MINRDHHETYYADTPSLPGYEVLRRHGDHFQRVTTEQGPVYIAGGRVDDTMNLGGIKISSAEIERVLNQVEIVTETAAVAVPSDTGPDLLSVFAVLNQPDDWNDDVHSELLAEMNRQLKSQLNPLFRVSTLEVVDHLPRTASGKVMRRKLRG